MDNLTRKIIGVLICVFILSIAYYGTYLPLKKSRSFIEAMKSMRYAKSVDDFKSIASVPLDIPSPIGQEELVRNIANAALNLVQRTDDTAIINAVMDFIEERYRPVIDRGRGMSFEQNLYILGAMNETAFVKTKEKKYFDAAKIYYSMGLELGPKRPQFLYGMFDIYRLEGNVDGAKGIAERILSQWPNDARIGEGLNDFLAKILTKNQ
ncbi:MAG: hypothetical protein AAB655_02875 [Patescibacteria group bacterium]